MVHTYNPTILEERQEDHKFRAKLDYIARPCLNKTKWKQTQEEMYLKSNFIFYLPCLYKIVSAEGSF